MGANKFTHTCLVDTLSLSALKVSPLIYKGAIENVLTLLSFFDIPFSIPLTSFGYYVRRHEIAFVCNQKIPEDAIGNLN